MFSNSSLPKKSFSVLVRNIKIKNADPKTTLA